MYYPKLFIEIYFVTPGGFEPHISAVKGQGTKPVIRWRETRTGDGIRTHIYRLERPITSNQLVDSSIEDLIKEYSTTEGFYYSVTVKFRSNCRCDY